MSESARSFVRRTAPSVDAVSCWSDTRDPSNSQPTSLRQRIDRREKPADPVTTPDATAVVMVIALAITAIGLSASGVIYLFNELLSYGSMDLVDLIAGMR